MKLEIKYQVKNSNPNSNSNPNLNLNSNSNSNWNLNLNNKLKWANEVQNRSMKTKILSRNLTNIGKAKPNFGNDNDMS